jgi:hypothetical protein
MTNSAIFPLYRLLPNYDDNNSIVLLGEDDTREITSILRQAPGWKFYGATYCGKPYGKQR